MARLIRATAILLAFVLAVASASRIPADYDAKALKDYVTSLKGRGGGGGGGRGGDEKAYLQIKFYVPPSEHDRFIQAWKTLEKQVMNDKDVGVVVFDLGKHITDNIHFAGYSEWENHHEMMAHFQKGYADDFKDFAAKHGIKWELMPMKNVTGNNEMGKAYYRSMNRKAKDTTHVLFTYHVPAMHHKMFLDAWDRKAKDTWNEDGNLVYSLRKVATNNEVFQTYGAWESHDDFISHAMSKHTQRFHNCIYGKDIVFHMTPITPFGRTGF